MVKYEPKSFKVLRFKYCEKAKKNNSFQRKKDNKLIISINLQLNPKNSKIRLILSSSDELLFFVLKKLGHKNKLYTKNII